MIVAFMWWLTRVFGYYLDYLQKRFSENLDEEKDSDKKAKLTHISVARRVAIFIAMLASIGIIQAYATTEHTLCIRLLCSAKTSDEAWLMHCELREKMNSYLASLENGNYLPRERQENI